MLDPLSALAVAAACVQFVDFAWKLITRKDAIFNKSNSTARTDELFQVADKLQKLIQRLGSSTGSNDCSEGLRIIREKCRAIQKLLVDPLNRLKETPKREFGFSTRGGSRKFPSAWHVLDKELGSEEIAKLHNELEGLRQELQITILMELRGERNCQTKCDHPTQTSPLPGQISNTALGEDFLDEIEEDTRYEWRTAIIKAILEDDNVREPIRELTVDTKCAEHFLDNLGFKKMFARFNNVTTAFDQTFEWLFEPKRAGHSWVDFRRWLAEDRSDRTYWISAKPGAGKSTLMKFIDSHSRTEQYLRHWANQQDSLIRASFYFYYGGPELEKSKKGLLLSLLYQILGSDNTLIGKYCPKRAEIHHLFGKCTLPWSMDELESVTFSVLKDESKKFFLLFDGLDECVEDHAELVAFLRELSRDNNVKLCVSSRPSPEFEDHFAKGPHLRLQELTMPDIQHFIRSKISDCPAFVDFQMSDDPIAGSLVETIAQKSQGVFLWVEFVVRAIKPELTAGTRNKRIEELLKNLPEDLENLFRQLLGMIKEHHKEDAYQIFRLVEAAQNAKTSHEHLSVLTLSFAQDDGEPDTFAKIIDAKITDKQGRCNKINRRLMAYCKGLLEIIPPPKPISENSKSGSRPPEKEPVSDGIKNDIGDQVAPATEISVHSTVQYMHRTVKEFLEKDGIWASFSSALEPSSFDPYAALCRASILQLKNTELTHMTKDVFWGMVQDALHYAALSDIEAQDPLIPELDILDTIANHIARMSWPKEPGNLFTRHMGAPPKNMPCSVQEEYVQTSHWSAVQAEGGSKHSFLCLAVQWGLCSYVQAKLESGTSVEQDPESRSLLDCVIRDFEIVSNLERAPPIGYDQRIAMIKVLLCHHDDPNRRDEFGGTPWIYLQGQLKDVSRAGRLRPQKQYSRVFIAKQPQSPALPQKRVEPQKLQFWLAATELFVQYGANCRTVDIKSVTEVLRRCDEERADALKRNMKARRPSLSYFTGFTGFFTRRKSEISLNITGRVVTTGPSSDITLIHAEGR